MLPKHRNKFSSKKSAAKNEVKSSSSRFSVNGPQDFGLTGSNMNINIRLGSNRALEKNKQPSMLTACKSEDCLNKPIDNCDGATATATARMIMSDRPATAGYSLSNRRSQFSHDPRRRSTICRSSMAREYNEGNHQINSKTSRDCWDRPTSSQSNNGWSSSVDSELATVGSFETGSSSLDDKQSFAVFGSISFDSRENLAHGNELTGRVMKNPDVTSAPSVPAGATANSFTGIHENSALNGAHSGRSANTRAHFQSSLHHHFEDISENGSRESSKADDDSSKGPLLSESSVIAGNIRERKGASSSNRYQKQPTATNSQVANSDQATDQAKDNSRSAPSSKYARIVSVDEPHHQSSDKTIDSTANEFLQSMNDTADEVSSVHTAIEERETIEKPVVASTNSPRQQQSCQSCSDEQNKDSNQEEAKMKNKRGPDTMLSEILNFLDGTNNQTAAVNSPLPLINSETESNLGGFRGGEARPGVGSENINKLRNMTKTELSEEVLSLQMLVQDKDNKLVMMERALQHQRELLARSVKTTQREMNLRCKTQREEYETTLNRHVHFIQQLVEEKKKLAEKCETLVSEMRQQNSRAEYERRISEERHSTEIRRLKQSFGKDHRFHQDKWVADQTGKIREATARGLEPELRRLMGQHQIELQSLRSIHQEELIRVEQAQISKSVQQLNSLRERMETDREEACAKEREMMRIKYSKQLDEVEAHHAAKYQRLQAEMDRERKRWLEEESRNKMQEEENMRSNEERWGRERKAAQQLFHAEIETLKQQHAEHLNLLRQKWEEDKKEELAALRHSLEVKFNEKERFLVDTQRKEREEDAHNFSRHLSEEVKRQHEEWKVMSEQQLQRIRDKHAEEVELLDQSEKELRNKLLETRRFLTDRDEELASLRLTLFQHVKENGDVKKTLEQFSAERSDLRNVLQKEMENEFRQQELEKRQLHEEFMNFKSESRMEINKKNLEIAQMSASHEKMLADIHEKVKNAVSKKDETVAQMQEKLKIALARCQHLEELLDRQSRDLLGRKHFN